MFYFLFIYSSVYWFICVCICLFDLFIVYLPYFHFLSSISSFFIYFLIYFFIYRPMSLLHSFICILLLIHIFIFLFSFSFSFSFGDWRREWKSPDCLSRSWQHQKKVKKEKKKKKKRKNINQSSQILKAKAHKSNLTEYRPRSEPQSHRRHR